MDRYALAETEVALADTEVPLSSMIQNMAVTGGLARTMQTTATFKSPMYASVGEQLTFGASVGDSHDASMINK